MLKLISELCSEGVLVLAPITLAADGAGRWAKNPQSSRCWAVLGVGVPSSFALEKNCPIFVLSVSCGRSMLVILTLSPRRVLLLSSERLVVVDELRSGDGAAD